MDLLGSVATVFDRAGFEIFLVGGSVRDRLLGRPFEDLDLTTNARPPDIKRLLGQAKPDHIYEVGAKFGTIGAVFGAVHMEVTTYRKEWYPGPSRKPEVEFGNDLREDLARRDFTINAIAQNVTTGAIVDPYHGVSDLARRTIQAVGNPAERLAEDPLRMLRAVRLAVQLDFTLDKETAQSISGNAARLQYISAERIRDELMKILVSSHPDVGIAALFELGLMRFVIPELSDMPSTVQDKQHTHKDVLAHTLRVLAGVPAEPLLRLAALLHDVGKPKTKSVKDGKIHFYRHEDVGARMTRDILKRLRVDNATATEVTRLVALHMRSNLYTSDWTDGAVRRFIREIGDSRERLLALSRADITSYRPRRIEAGLVRVAELEARCQQLVGEADVERMDSPLDGDELMDLFGREPGRWIKPIKDHLLELVLDGALDQDDKEQGAILAKAFAARQDSDLGDGPPADIRDSNPDEEHETATTAPAGKTADS